jgi:hypothetical protein
MALLLLMMVVTAAATLGSKLLSIIWTDGTSHHGNRPLV